MSIQIYQTLLIAFVLFAPAWGSFVAADIVRREKLTKATGERSMCDHCGVQLKWYELIPLVSYIIQRGKCNNCGERIPIGFWLAEVVSTVIISVYAIGELARLDSNPLGGHRLLLYFVFVSNVIVLLTLVYLSVFDLLTFTIPVSVLQFGLGVIIVVNLVAGVMRMARVPGSEFLELGVADNLLLALLLAAGLWLVVKLTKEKGLGLGDVYLAALFGAGLGWPESIAWIYVMLFTALPVGFLVALQKGKFKGVRVPLVPFMSLAFSVSLIWGDQIFKFLFWVI